MYVLINNRYYKIKLLLVKVELRKKSIVIVTFVVLVSMPRLDCTYIYLYFY